MTLGLGSALLLALGLWWVGVRQGRPRAWLPLAPALTAALLAVAILPIESPAEATTGGLLKSEPFTEARLASLRSAQRPVFVYFTADWCITCKANERGALASAEVAEAFRARNVAVMVGDWTMGDAAIGRFLEQQGRSGVPLYLYYASGRDGEILPQVLTSAMLVERVG